MPLHSSPGDRARLCLKKQTNKQNKQTKNLKGLDDRENGEIWVKGYKLLAAAFKKRGFVLVLCFLVVVAVVFVYFSLFFPLGHRKYFLFAVSDCR